MHQCLAAILEYFSKKMDSRLIIVSFFLYGVFCVSGSSIAQRKNGDEAEGVSKQNFKRQFVIYPNDGGFGHHHHPHHHHHQYHEGFFDGYQGGEGLGYDTYHDHGNMEDMDVPQFEHVHHQYKHIHHVSE